MKILLSGGHLTPALALIDYIQKNTTDSCVFVGREYAQEKTKQPSQEKTEVTKRGIVFIPYATGKLIRLNPIVLIPQGKLLLTSFFRALSIFKTEKPDVYVSFGSYLAVPLTLAAWILHIPIVTHEQTQTAGVANKLVAKFAQKVAISHQSSANYFPAAKVVLTGNPVRPQILAGSKTAPEWMSTSKEKPILYITGGSQGSQRINQVVSEVLTQLTQKWLVIHQCGKPTTAYNGLTFLEAQRNKLPPEQQNCYFIREWLTEQELAWIYQHTQIIISRAGANTIQELTALGKPALFIPLPLTHDDEQTKNAQAVVDQHAALLLPQSEVSPNSLLERLDTFERNYSELAKNAEQIRSTMILNADERLYQLISKVCK
jgi:UDP-N-acetylglucosamine--N-acetylmuramyl-(pentapeptide) pyrophosphoryl-undecaprenol N-acetylglucosamine transferase